MPSLGLLASSDDSVVGGDIEAGSCARHTIHATDLRRVPTTAALIESGRKVEDAGDVAGLRQIPEADALIEAGSVVEHPVHVADLWCGQAAGVLREAECFYRTSNSGR